MTGSNRKVRIDGVTYTAKEVADGWAAYLTAEQQKYMATHK